jgi:hypothetical protein
MECELEVICLDTRILTFHLPHRLYYFVNSYNGYNRAYSVKHSPDYEAPFLDRITGIVKPFIQLRAISRECGHQNAPAGDHGYSIA